MEDKRFCSPDYGNGDRYAQAQNEDRAGISKAALKIAGKHKNIKGVLTVGTKAEPDSYGTTNGDMDVKSAYLEVSNLAGSGVTVSVGVQPLLFGLKPNGYKGDRTIQGSVEYGAGGGLAVASQAGTAIIASTNVGPVNIRGGFFELNSGNNSSIDQSESSLTDNYFVQAYARNIAGSGFYGVMGYESVLVGANNTDEIITSLGLGWENSFLDFSAERITLSEQINGTSERDSYTVLELGLKPNSKTNLYADYSQADQSGVDTIRTGINYDYNDYASLTLEYSKDKRDIQPDVESVDLRVTVSF